MFESNTILPTKIRYGFGYYLSGMVLQFIVSLKIKYYLKKGCVRGTFLWQIEAKKSRTH